MTGLAIFDVLAFAEGVALFLQIALGIGIAAALGWYLIRRNRGGSFTRGRR